MNDGGGEGESTVDGGGEGGSTVEGGGEGESMVRQYFSFLSRNRSMVDSGVELGRRLGLFGGLGSGLVQGPGTRTRTRLGLCCEARSY